MKVYIGRYPKGDKEQTVRVRIDPWDTWGMDNTLAHIIAPMLKQLQATNHGAPHVKDEDVPVELHSTAPVDENGHVDDNWFKRWDYVLGEMIFAFDTLNTDWEHQFWKVQPEMDFTHYPEDEGKSSVPVRWKVEGECDWDGMKAMQDRMTNGFRLFGKYYQSLWD
jgi:hypothetical protein